MTEITLESLNAFISAGEKLKKLLTETPEIIEYLRLVTDGDKNILPIKSDVLVRVGEAAKILGVNKETIYRYATEKILTPLYTPYSGQMKFWLSEVKAVVKKGGVEEHTNGKYD